MPLEHEARSILELREQTWLSEVQFSYFKIF